MKRAALKDKIDFIARVIAFAILVAVIIWWSATPRASDAPLIARCNDLYARARTAADTLGVDAIHPLERSRRSNPSALRCGTLRQAGRLTRARD